MIQQIYITDYLSDAAAESAAVIQHMTDQCPILLKGDWQVNAATPLNALFGTLHDADHTPGLSKVATILRTRQASVTGVPVLCVLPVHLGLQRDTFSLQGTVQISPAVYAYLTETLQQHFLQDFIVHATAEQRFWWVQPLNPLEVQCPWPQDCLYQQAFQWQPQGTHASLIRQWTNESQMLLHQFSQDSRLPGWPERLNSLWFASVPAVPVWQHDWQAVIGTGAVFDGLQRSQLSAVKQLSMAQVLEDKTITKALMVVDQIDQVDWHSLSAALQKGRISTLEIILPLAERSIKVTYKQRYRWQFWRKAQTLPGLFDKLEASLPTFKLPGSV
ncbi:MAG: hypothetical protein ACTS9Y_01480 [Methylophilus sp.]|uniref:hypothetical protein n=1 Tax=Methylophilus sp. TaxID=29541 RepID=UPI003F9F0845